ncbi:MAG: D-arabinono-1,4-lactone oxidase [Ilumatobacteraceae bacterium]
MFCSPRHVRFVEMEYGIPAHAVPEAVERVRRLTRASQRRRCSRSRCACRPATTSRCRRRRAATRVGSPCTSTAACPISSTSRGVESIMDDYDGRPHWGKLHFQTAATLAPRYPRWNEFISVRDRLDPTGTFRNDYLDRVLSVR